MSNTLVTSGQGNYAGPTLDTTGANFLVALFCGGSAGSSVVDNKGNTWTARTAHTVSTYRHRIFDCVNPVSVGTSHVISDSVGAVSNARIHVLAFNVSVALAYQAENGANDGTFSGTSAATGSATTTQNGGLVIAGVSHGPSGTSTSGFSVDNSLTIAESTGAASSIGGVSAYLDQATAGAINPTFTWTTNARWASSIAVYQPSGGGGGGGSGAVIGNFLFRQAQRIRDALEPRWAADPETGLLLPA